MQARHGRAAHITAMVAGIGFLAARAAFAHPATPSETAVRLPPIVVSAAEPHPEIWAAIHSLERAKGHLKAAAHDFGGHRVEAIGAIDAALNQLHTCLQYDR